MGLLYGENCMILAPSVLRFWRLKGRK